MKKTEKAADRGERPNHRAKTEAEKEIDQQIGQRISYVRNVLAGQTLEAFGVEIGVSAQAVHYWETGKGVTAFNLTRISDVHAILMDWLVKGIGRPRESFENRMRLLPFDEQEDVRDLFDGLIDKRLDRIKNKPDS
jgi:hypothetical protein